MFAVQARMGLSSLTGEQGIGKTVVLECLRDSLESSQIHCAFLRDSRISTNRFFQAIAAELDLRCQGTSAYQVFSALHQFTLEQARNGRTVALIVDDADNLPADVLNEILHLASLQGDKVKLLQTVLAGRPELHATLDALNLERLKQRAILSCHLEPFTALETQNYIDFRLAQAGLSAQTIFPPDAIAEIYDRSRGFAPAIHAICEGLLLAAFSARSAVCTPEILDQVFGNPRGEEPQVEEVGTVVAVARADLARLAVPTELEAAPEPEPPALLTALLRLAFDASKQLPPPLPVHASERLEPHRSALRPMFPSWKFALPVVGLALGSKRPIRLADGNNAAVRHPQVHPIPSLSIISKPVISQAVVCAEPRPHYKLQRLVPNRMVLIASPSAVLATAIDFPSIALQPANSAIEGVHARAALLTLKGVNKLVPLAWFPAMSEPPAGAHSFSIPCALSLEPIRPAARLQPAGTVRWPRVRVTLLPLLYKVLPSPAQVETPIKTFLNALPSLQPLCPVSRLEPVNTRPSLLQLPTWQLPTWVPRETNPVAASAETRKLGSSHRKWLLTLALPILAGLAFYGASPAMRTTADAINHTVNQGWRRAHQAVLDRAAVALDEDFRTGLDNWTNRGGARPSWTSDAAGFVHPGALALYRPSLGLVDYHMQFVGTIDKKALSWVVRAADFNNYYAIRLTVLKPGPTPVIGMTRYAVIHGKTQSQVTMPLVMNARPDTVYRVSLDMHGDHFALAVQDQPVDSWSEPKLRHGGIGFFSEQDAGSRVAGVQVRGQYDMLGRLCAFLAPSGIPSYRAAFNERVAITD